MASDVLTKKPLLLAALMIAIVAFSVSSTYAVRRNEIAARRTAIDQAWSRVNLAVLGRNDMVPTVLSNAQAIAHRHAAVAAQVREAANDVQSAATPVDTIAASRHLDAAMSKLYAAAQDDPSLLVNHRFFVLQDKWAAATNRIANEQLHYDRAVSDYNDFISAFPNRVFARWASFATVDNLFEATGSPLSHATGMGGE